MTRRESVMKLRDLAYRANHWTSFVPERRGEQLLDYAETTLQENEAKIPEELRATFEERFLKYFTRWLCCKSRCSSTVITGGANYNVRRAEKANEAERNAYEAMTDWVERFVKRVNTQHRLTGWAEIERLQNKVEVLKERQEFMKQVNAIFRKKNMADVERVDAIVQIGCTEEEAVKLVEGEDRYGNGRRYHGFESWALSNNLSNIKATEERIMRLTRIANSEDKSFMVGDVKVEICNAEERIRLHFEGKPDKATIFRLKSFGFRWSPSNMAWQRQLTNNAIYAAERFLGVDKLKPSNN